MTNTEYENICLDLAALETRVEDIEESLLPDLEERIETLEKIKEEIKLLLYQRIEGEK